MQLGNIRQNFRCIEFLEADVLARQKCLSAKLVSRKAISRIIFASGKQIGGTMHNIIVSHLSHIAPNIVALAKRYQFGRSIVLVVYVSVVNSLFSTFDNRD